MSSGDSSAFAEAAASASASGGCLLATVHINCLPALFPEGPAELHATA